MRIATRQQKCIAVIVVAMLAWSSFAEDGPRRGTGYSRRGESVVFSGSVTDTASTNLTLNKPKFSLKSLEEDIKKPFDFFDRESALPSTRPLPVIRQQDMIERTKRSQELMRRKEDAFFDVGDDKEKDKEEDPYSLNAEKRKLKSPLERYYERVDREQSAFTNQFKSHDPFFRDRKQKEDQEEVFSLFFGNNRSGDDPQLAAITARRMSNNPVGGGLFSTESVKPRTIDDLLGFTQTAITEQDKVQEKVRDSRMEAFKKLIGVDSYAPSKPSIESLYSPTTAPASQPRPPASYSIPSPASYLPSASPSSAPASVSGYSSKPYDPLQSAQAYGNTPSLMPTPVPFNPPKPKSPPPGFNIPERKF